MDVPHGHPNLRLFSIRDVVIFEMGANLRYPYRSWRVHDQATLSGEFHRVFRFYRPPPSGTLTVARGNYEALITAEHQN